MLREEDKTGPMPPYMKNPQGRMFITTEILFNKKDMTPHWPDGEPKKLTEVVKAEVIEPVVADEVLAPVNEKGNPFKDPNKCSRAVLVKRAKETFGVILDKTEPIETVRAKYKALEEAS